MSQSPDTITVSHHVEDIDGIGPHFAISVNGETAGYAAYVDQDTVDGSLRDFNHTVIDPAFRGRGLSTPLLEHALSATVEQGRAIRPTCSAVEHFLSKHPEFAKHVAS